jgi:hypothetical protein
MTSTSSTATSAFFDLRLFEGFAPRFERELLRAMGVSLG